MKISIDTDILSKHDISLGEYLLLLIGYFNVNAKQSLNKLVYKSLGDTDWRDEYSLILSDNTKDLISRIIIESSPKLERSPVKDFEALARKLMDIYPEGNKEGTTYPWRGTIEEIAQKLRVIVVEHNFIFTEEEAIDAVKTYVKLFTDINDFSKMKFLKYFILRTKTHDGEKEIVSDFMTIIENSR